MRRWVLVFALLCGGCLWAQDQNIHETGNSPVEAKFHGGGKIRMEVCPSGTEIVGTDESVLRVSFHPERDSVSVRMQVSDNRADIRIGGCPRNNFHARIEVPKTSSLYVRMMAGQLDVRGIEGDKDLAVSFGQLSVEMGETSQYHRVDASVNSGEINAVAFSVNKGGLFRSFTQRGPGKYDLETHVGAGQIDLR